MIIQQIKITIIHHNKIKLFFNTIFTSNNIMTTITTKIDHQKNIQILYITQKSLKKIIISAYQNCIFCSKHYQLVMEKQIVIELNQKLNFILIYWFFKLIHISILYFMFQKFNKFVLIDIKAIFHRKSKYLQDLDTRSSIFRQYCFDLKFSSTNYFKQQFFYVQSLQSKYTNMISKPIQCGSYTFWKKDIIGSGSFSTVYKGSRREIPSIKCQYVEGTDQNVAIKILYKMMENDQSQIDLIKDEIKILKLFQEDPFIINLQDAFQDDKKIYLVTDYCDGGTLKDYIDKKGKLDCMEALELFKQIVKGYEVIYNRNIIHRDLKPDNILLKSGQIKIGDFGFAIRKSQVKKEICLVGSPSYMPLQTLKKNQYSSKGDLWALGITLFQMVNGDTPYHASTTKQLIKQISFIPIKRIIPERVTSDINKILLGLLQVNPEKRMNLLQLKQLLFPDEVKNMFKLSLDVPLTTFQQNQEIRKKSKSNCNVKVKTSDTVNKSDFIKQNSSAKSTDYQIDKEEILNQALMSQLHLCRFIYRIVKRSDQNATQIINYNTRTLLIAYIFQKLMEIQSLNMFTQEIAQTFKQGKTYKKLLQLSEKYMKRYENQLMIPRQTTLESISKLFNSITNNIRDILERIQKKRIELCGQKIIILDYLSAFYQFAQLLQRVKIVKFSKYSKIQKILQLQPMAIDKVSQKQLLEIKKKMLRLKIL